MARALTETAPPRIQRFQRARARWKAGAEDEAEITLEPHTKERPASAGKQGGTADLQGSSLIEKETNDHGRCG